jgi:tRNA(fMet)-specific endonuclease VapC
VAQTAKVTRAIALVLDTNHFRELEVHSPLGARLLSRIDASGEPATITAVTVEEQMRGWLAEIKRHARPRQQIAAYERLVCTVELHARWRILPWNEDAADTFESWPRLRVGTQDLKIAAITIAHRAVRLTRNTVDFSKVPGLRFANWLD